MAREIDFSTIDEEALEQFDDNFSRLLELGNEEQQNAAREALRNLETERCARRARSLARRAVAAGYA